VRPPALVAGEYYLGELLATTALGSVYQARHLPSGRMAAVTLLPSIAGDPAAMESFRAELPAVARLRYPNLLPVESWGEADGIPYVVTPEPNAEPLADLLARGGRPHRDAALRLLRGIAAGIDHAHRLGVVHGGLEPAVVRIAADGRAVVADFRLARLARAAPLSGGAGIHHGSPAHVAPEWVLAGTVGPAADVYALAVIAYELLTGAVPFEGESAVEQLYAQVHQAPRPASAHDASLAAADAVLLRGLDRDPAARWASCGQMVDAIEAALAAPPGPSGPRSEVSGPRQALPREGGRSGRRNLLLPRAWIVAAGGLLLLLAVAGAAVVAAGRAGGPASAAVSRNLQGPASGGSALATPTVAPSPASPTSPAVGQSPPAIIPTAPAAPPGRSTPATPAPRPSTAAPASGVSITVRDRTPTPLEWVQVDGLGFDPTQQYVITLQQGGNRWQVQGTASPRGDGTFANPIQVPGNAQVGAALVVGCVYVVNQGPTNRCGQQSVSIR
jgi:serine/threonine protein kinase